MKKAKNDPQEAAPAKTMAVETTDSIFLQTNIVPTITPLTWEGDIDTESLPKYLDHLHALGVKAIFVMGLTGEFTRLDNVRRLQGIRAFTKHNQNRFRLFINATGDTEDETIANVRAVEKIGTDGLALAPLYYLKNSIEMVPHLQKLKSQYPLMVHNVSAHANTQNIDPEVIQDLA